MPLHQRTAAKDGRRAACLLEDATGCTKMQHEGKAGVCRIAPGGPPGGRHLPRFGKHSEIDKEGSGGVGALLGRNLEPGELAVVAVSVAVDVQDGVSEVQSPDFRRRMRCPVVLFQLAPEASA